MGVLGEVLGGILGYPGAIQVPTLGPNQAYFNYYWKNLPRPRNKSIQNKFWILSELAWVTTTMPPCLYCCDCFSSQIQAFICIDGGSCKRLKKYLNKVETKSMQEQAEIFIFLYTSYRGQCAVVCPQSQLLDQYEEAHLVQPSLVPTPSQYPSTSDRSSWSYSTTS